MELTTFHDGWKILFRPHLFTSRLKLNCKDQKWTIYRTGSANQRDPKRKLPSLAYTLWTHGWTDKYPYIVTVITHSLKVPMPCSVSREGVKILSVKVLEAPVKIRASVGCCRMGAGNERMQENLKTMYNIWFRDFCERDPKIHSSTVKQKHVHRKPQPWCSFSTEMCEAEDVQLELYLSGSWLGSYLFRISADLR